MYVIGENVNISCPLWMVFTVPALFFVYHSKYYLTLLRLCFRQYMRNKKKRCAVSYEVNKREDRVEAPDDYNVEEEELPPGLKLD